MNTYSNYEMIDNLTTSETIVLKLLANGKSNIEIANELIISPHTAKAHVSHILSKLQVENRVQAAVKAVKENIIDFNKLS